MNGPFKTYEEAQVAGGKAVCGGAYEVIEDDSGYYWEIDVDQEDGDHWWSEQQENEQFEVADEYYGDFGGDNL